jgi:ATP-dependent protease HslVU (ClpYQ) peptidase subunit
MSETKKDKRMVVTEKVEIKRLNHVKALCKKKGWDKDLFIRQGMAGTTCSFRTLFRAFDGEKELSMDTVEQLAKLFNVTKDEVLESVW